MTGWRFWARGTRPTAAGKPAPADPDAVATVPDSQELTDRLVEDEAPLGLGVDAPVTLKGAEHLAGQRFALAKILFAFTAVLSAVLLAGAVWAPAEAWTRLDRVGTLTLVPILTLLGTAIGWYFGEKSASGK